MVAKNLSRAGFHNVFEMLWVRVEQETTIGFDVIYIQKPPPAGAEVSALVN